MKLIIQIPCYNEEQTLHIALGALPRKVEGFDCVEWLIIDDGSRDNTSEIARQCGVDHIIKHHNNKGLAKAFMTGINACLEKDADVIVNTDADNQYEANDIVKLTTPIIEGKAEFVIGARPVQTIAHFSPIKNCYNAWAAGLSVLQVKQIFLMLQAVSELSAEQLHRN